MNPGCCKALRDRAAAAAARAAAPVFFAWRWKRRCLRREEPSAARPAPHGSRTERRRRRSDRPRDRLRDRVRAVSYRICAVSRSDKLTHLPQGVEVKVVPETLKSPVRAPECSVGLSEKDTRLRQRLLELRLGPHYLMYVANSSRTTNPVTEHVDRLCWSKGLVAFGSEGTTVYREMMLWGRVLDDLLFRDFVDFTRSKGVERAARYLFGMEAALEHVGSITQLDRANWVAVKILDLDPHGDADVFARAGKLCSQTRRAASRQARLRWLTKKFGGVSQSVWHLAQREMESGLDRCRDPYEKGTATGNAKEEAETGMEDALRHQSADAAWEAIPFKGGGSEGELAPFARQPL